MKVGVRSSQGPKVKRNRHGRREFAALDKVGRFEGRHRLAAMRCARECIERKIDGKLFEEWADRPN